MIKFILGCAIFACAGADLSSNSTNGPSTVIANNSSPGGLAFTGAWAATPSANMSGQEAIGTVCDKAFFTELNLLDTDTADFDTNPSNPGNNWTAFGLPIGSIWSFPHVISEDAANDGDVCHQFPAVIDYSNTVELKYTTNEDRNRELQAILSATYDQFNKSDIFGLTLYFDSANENVGQNGERVVKYRILGLSTKAVDYKAHIDKLQSLFQANPPPGMSELSATVVDNVPASSHNASHNDIMDSLMP